MRQGGHHLILDLEGCDARLLDSPAAMARFCRRVGRLMGVRILDTRAVRFCPQGVTAFCVLAESHISVHTWPESGQAFLDVFTCQRRFLPDPVIALSLEALGAKAGRLAHLLREGGRVRLVFHGAVLTDGAGFAFGRTIFSAHSAHQRIELTRGPLGVSLFLNGWWQFVERYERAYHESLVHPAAVCAPRLDRVGIAGGGDGLALRELLRYPDLGRVVLYEIDPLVLALAQGHPEMLRLNGRSLLHPKSQVVAEDARRMLAPGSSFDLLIVDFPSPGDGGDFSHLYGFPFYRRAKQALARDGVLVVQVSDFEATVERIAARLRRLFRRLERLTVMGDGKAMYTFLLAADRPLRPRRPLPRGLGFLTQGRLARLFEWPALVTASRAGRRMAPERFPTLPSY